MWWAELDGSIIVEPDRGDRRRAASTSTVADLDLPEGLHTLELRLGTGADPGEAARSPARAAHVLRPRHRRRGRAPRARAPRLGGCSGATRPQAEWEDALSVPELLVDPVVGPVP